ncbi:hypothetical protein CYG48_05015 [Neorhizobium sp. SOG26]|nr:hypothetical protein CYG48_05015 [Neorhizobium sp. SOG26]
MQRLREQLAGGDEKFLKHLERYKSVDAITKMVREARQAAQNAGKPIMLTDKSTPEEVKAFREAYGIPEDPAAYPGDFRQDFKASDADKAILGEFKQAMHSRHVPPAAAAAALEWYQDFATAQQQELDGNLVKVAKETQSSLRQEWGGEYDGNIGAINELMTSHLGKDGFEEMMSLRMTDGSRLQDHAPFVKMMAQIATDYYGSNAIFNGDIETTSKTLEEKIAETREVQTKDPEKYRSAQYQEYVAGLYAQKQKLDARKG